MRVLAASFALIGSLFFLGCVNDRGSGHETGDALVDFYFLQQMLVDQTTKFRVSFKNETNGSLYIGRGALSSGDCATGYFDLGSGFGDEVTAGVTSKSLVVAAGSYPVQWVPVFGSSSKKCAATQAYAAGNEYRVRILSSGTSATIEQITCTGCFDPNQTMLLLLAARGKGK